MFETLLRGTSPPKCLGFSRNDLQTINTFNKLSVCQWSTNWRITTKVVENWLHKRVWNKWVEDLSSLNARERKYRLMN